MIDAQVTLMLSLPSWITETTVEIRGVLASRPRRRVDTPAGSYLGRSGALTRLGEAPDVPVRPAGLAWDLRLGLDRMSDIRSTYVWQRERTAMSSPPRCISWTEGALHLSDEGGTRTHEPRPRFMVAIGPGEVHDPRGHLTRPSSGPHGLHSSGTQRISVVNTPGEYQEVP